MRPASSAVATATTDANGHFILKDVPAGRYIIEGGIKGRAGKGRARINLAAGKTLDIAIQVPPRSR